MYNFRHLSHPKRVQLSSGKLPPPKVGGEGEIEGAVERCSDGWLVNKNILILISGSEDFTRAYCADAA